MIDQLFGSKTRVKLLRMFMTNPNRSFYVREITRKIDEQINSVRRELGNLLSIGIISSDSSNNRLYYEVNQKFEHYEALASLFGGRKVVAKSSTKEEAEEPEPKATADNTKQQTKATTKTKVAKKAAKPAGNKIVQPTGDEKILGNVELLLLGGIFTRSQDAPVDILIVGNVTQKGLDKYVADLEKTVGEEVSYALFNLDEFNYRRQIKDKFITTMLNTKLTVKVDRHGLIDVK